MTLSNTYLKRPLSSLVTLVTLPSFGLVFSALLISSISRLVACVLRSAVCLLGLSQGELDLVIKGSGDGENASVGACRVCVWSVGGFVPKVYKYTVLLSYSNSTTPPHLFLVH